MKLADCLGETNLYDKKEQLEVKKPKSWLKSVSAFANGRGGKLIFGVKEDNTVIGLKDYRKDSEDISEIIKMKTDPNPEFNMEIKEIEGKVILILTIFAGKNTPFFVVDGGSRIAYKRIGNQSVPASRIDLFNLSLKGEHISYDSLQSKKNLEDVTFKELIGQYKERTGIAFEEKDLRSFGLVNDEGNLTIAGALFADGYQVYQSRVFCTRWNGLTKSNLRMDALDDKEFEGNIIYLLMASFDFIKRNSKTMWKKGPVYRIEYLEYPERAVQEALVNALIHRDYSIIGSEVHVDIFDDRLEIYSPGGMYDGSVIQNLDPLTVSSVRRNPIIADLFARMYLMERRGSGLRKIIEAYKAMDNYREELKPKFKSSESFFMTSLRNLIYDTQNVTQNDTQNVTQNEDGRITPDERREKIITVLRSNSKITAYELSREFDVSERTIRRDLKILSDEKIIEYVGSSKGGFWKINNY